MSRDYRRWAAEYWDRRVPKHRWFRTHDVARLPFVDVTQRTVQRWIQQGLLHAAGSTDHSTHEARVSRDALIDFLVRRTSPMAYPPQADLFEDAGDPI